LVTGRGAPLAALASGSWAHTMAERAQLAQAASRRQVTAVVLTTPAIPKIGSGDMASVAPARWTAPDGMVVTGEMPVPIGTTAGATIPAWAADWQLTGPRWTTRA
jgi:hypothetical protein